MQGVYTPHVHVYRVSSIHAEQACVVVHMLSLLHQSLHIGISTRAGQMDNQMHFCDGFGM